MQIKCKYKKKESFLCMQKLDPIRASQEATETVARYTIVQISREDPKRKEKSATNGFTMQMYISL